jgi:hypothetical protein
MSWTMLKAPPEWDQYRQQVARSQGVVPDAVAWGHGPQSYPCLVATLPTGTRPGEKLRLTSAYVYATDAEELLRAAGSGQQAPRSPDDVALPGQKDFNRWTAAHLMVIAYYLVETRICKKDDYETKLLEALELVDSVKVDDVEKYKRLLGAVGAGLLERPPSDG